MSRRGSTPRWSAVAPVKSFARDGILPREAAGLVLMPIIGALATIGGVADDRPGITVLGAGIVGVFLVGATSVVLQLRVLVPPAPALSVVGSRPATVLRREPVAFALGLATMAVMGATLWGWAYLAADSSAPLAVGLGALGLWMVVPTLLAVTGRFTAGVLALTPDGVDYRSRGLRLWFGWDDIGALGASMPMIMDVSTRDGSPVRCSRTAGWYTGEKLLTPTRAVLRTDAMAVHEQQLAPVLWRYVTHPADRAELGTSGSLVRFSEPAAGPDGSPGSRGVSHDARLRRCPSSSPT